MLRRPRVVLDSVVAVSAFLTTGLAAELVLLCEEKVDLYTAEKILQEIRYVLLAKPHIRNRYDYTATEVSGVYFIPFATPYLRGYRGFCHTAQAYKFSCQCGVASLPI